MADYKELLRRAVEALPENNGASRRAVYEKARAALVGQLRAINPPLAARDITAHRLQLEDCIRQVEQEASEAVIAGLSSTAPEPMAPTPVPNAPVYFDEPPPAQPKAPPSTRTQPPIPMKPAARTNGASAKSSGAAKEQSKLPTGGSIEDIIAAANAEQPAADARPQRSVVRTDAKPMGKPVPKLVTATRPHATIEAKLDSKASIEAKGDDRARPAVAEKTRPPVTAKVEKIEVDDEDEVPAAPVPAPVKTRPNGRPVPSIVARAEAAKSRNSSAAFGAPIDRDAGGGRRGPVLEPRRESLAATRGGHAVARQAAAEPIALFEEPEVGPAMSAIREVEEEPAEAQVAIDRAIATLDREAREVEAENDADNSATDAEFTTVEDAPEELPKPVRRNGTVPPSTIKLDPPSKAFRDGKPAREARDNRDAKPRRIAAPIAARKRKNGREALESAFEGRGDIEEKRGISAVTIFLVVFVLLIVGAGGAGVWAWREGFINLDTMFGRNSAPVQQQAAAVTSPVTSPAAPEAPATGPGNTDTATVAAPTAELKQDDRLSAEPATQALPLVNTGPNAELTTSPQSQVADNTPSNDALGAAQQAVDPASVAGSQSLLLEAQDNGAQGAVPFSGTVEWSKGTDEMGLPTLVAKANIPARNLGVDLLIRKNSDPSLPASHLMEINFHVNDSFVGGSVAGLPGVLLKNEELVQGKPLVGASARVVGNSFLFALSATPGDITTNTGLLENSKWMDLAVIYATGKRAIITLEKDDAAQKLFTDVESAWSKSASK